MNFYPKFQKAYIINAENDIGLRRGLKHFTEERIFSYI